MDAAQTNLKKTALFLATALLLAAPMSGYGQTLVAANSAVTIGSSACNDFQTIQLRSSTSTNIQFRVAVQYNPGDIYASTQWVYTTVANQGSTSTTTPFTANTGVGGVTLTIGLNSSSLAAASDSAYVTLTPIGPAGVNTTPIQIQVFYSQNSSCGGNTGSATNGTLTITPGNVSLTAGIGAQQ